MAKLASLVRRVYWSAFLAWHVLGQARYPFTSPQRIRRDADRRVRRMVRYAYRWVPYYRETLDRLGLAPRDIRSVDDLRKLPLISAADLQIDGDRFRSRQYDTSRLNAHHTSGSTGRPIEVWHTLASVYAAVAHGERETSIHRRIIGKGRRLVAMVLRSPLNTDSTRQLARANAFYPSRANMWRGGRGLQARVNDPPEKIIAALNDCQPDLFYAYGSMVARVYGYADEHGLTVHCPAVVRYASDHLPDTARQLLTERYGIQVFSAYQAIEMFKMGFECEAHSGYHINADLYPLRIVNEQGEDCAPGESGEIVVSNLTNQGTVLLNYCIGDRGAWASAPCPCGRHLPLISRLEGRVTDMIQLPDGRHLSHLPLATAIVSYGGIWQWQLVQHALDRATIRLKLAPGLDKAVVEADLRATITPMLGGMQLAFSFVDDMRRTGASKVRNVVNQIGQEPAPQAN